MGMITKRRTLLVQQGSFLHNVRALTSHGASLLLQLVIQIILKVVFTAASSCCFTVAATDLSCKSNDAGFHQLLQFKRVMMSALFRCSLQCQQWISSTFVTCTVEHPVLYIYSGATTFLFFLLFFYRIQLRVCFQSLHMMFTIVYMKVGEHSS